MSEDDFKPGEVIEVIPSSIANGLAKVVSVGRKNVFVIPEGAQCPEWIIAYPNKKGTKLNEDIYSVPKFHCRKIP